MFDHWVRLSALALYPFLLIACGSASRVGEINVDFDEDADFSEFRTFTVLTSEIVPKGVRAPPSHPGFARRRPSRA